MHSSTSIITLWPEHPGFLMALALALKGTVLLAAAALAASLARNASAAVRHLVWCLGLAGALLVPVLYSVLPEWRVTFAWNQHPEPAPISIPSPDTRDALAPPGRGQTLESVEPMPASLEGGNLPATAPPVLPQRRAAENFAQVAGVHQPGPGRDHGFLIWLFPGWLLGVSIALLPLALGGMQMIRLTRLGRPLITPDWEQLLRQTRHELNLERKVRLFRIPRLKMPVTWGAWRAVILLPDEASSWPEERRRVVLLHELAHVRRFDWLTQTIALLCCAFYWFNPLTWLAARRMRVERELACDDLVIGSGIRPSDYADELLGFAASLKGERFLNWGGVPMARHSSLEGRLLAILDPDRKRGSLSGRALAGAWVVLAALLVPLVMIKAADRKASDQTAPSAPSSSSSSSFGPVIERTLFDSNGEHPAHSMIDLDSGKFATFDLDKREGIGGLEAMIRQIRENGVDLIGDASGKAFNTLDMVLVPVDEAWNSITARSVSDESRLAKPLEETVIKPKDTLPAAYLFRTKAGSRGVLEVLRFSDDLSSMDIRYKLVQGAGDAGHDPRKVARDSGDLRDRKVDQSQRDLPLERDQPPELLASPVSPKIKDKMPVLGDLPLLGRVFRSDAEVADDNTSELPGKTAVAERAASRASDPPTRSTSSRSYVFHKTYEREMRSEDRRYLDLETGTFVAAHPPGDLFYWEAENDLQARAGLNLVALPAEPEKWETADPQEVLQRVDAATPQKQVRLGGGESKLFPEPRQTWFFKTAEGSAGILQITPHPKRPGSVHIRYKLVRPRREFTPLTTVILSSTGPNRWLNLEDGRTLSAALTNSPVAWLKRDPKENWALMIENIYNYHSEREEGKRLWNTVSAEDLSEPPGLAAVPFERTGFYALKPEQLPVTVLIPQWGLLQVAEIDERTQSVIIQYKRITPDPLSGNPVQEDTRRSLADPRAPRGPSGK